jgi:PleD family two-component response regulator
VLPGLTACEAGTRLAEAQRFVAAGTSSVTISVGVVQCHAGESADALVARADRALYISRGSERQT